MAGDYWLDLDEHSSSLIGLRLSAGQNPTFVTLVGVSSQVSLDFGFITPTIVTAQFSLKKGWNLISLPIEPVNPDVSSFLSELKIVSNSNSTSIAIPNTIWEWNNKGDFHRQYLKATAIHALRGYWIYAHHGGDVEMRGHNVFNAKRKLFDGWNLVGTTATSGLTLDDILECPIWEWTNPGFTVVPRLMPEKGYWIRNDTRTLVDLQ